MSVIICDPFVIWIVCHMHMCGEVDGSIYFDYYKNLTVHITHGTYIGIIKHYTIISALENRFFYTGMHNFL